MVVEDLHGDSFIRQREVRTSIWGIPLRINIVAKTPEELDADLNPALLEICVDGVCLYWEEYFKRYLKKVMNALKDSGLKRKRVREDWCWKFEEIPDREWELTWEGFREPP